MIFRVVEAIGVSEAAKVNEAASEARNLLLSSYESTRYLNLII